MIKAGVKTNKRYIKSSMIHPYKNAEKLALVVTYLLTVISEIIKVLLNFIFAHLYTKVTVKLVPITGKFEYSERKEDIQGV